MVSARVDLGAPATRPLPNDSSVNSFRHPPYEFLDPPGTPLSPMLLETKTLSIVFKTNMHLHLTKICIIHIMHHTNLYHLVKTTAIVNVFTIHSYIVKLDMKLWLRP